MEAPQEAPLDANAFLAAITEMIGLVKAYEVGDNPLLEPSGVEQAMEAYVKPRTPARVALLGQNRQVLSSDCDPRGQSICDWARVWSVFASVTRVIM